MRQAPVPCFATGKTKMRDENRPSMPLASLPLLHQKQLSAYSCGPCSTPRPCGTHRLSLLARPSRRIRSSAQRQTFCFLLMFVFFPLPTKRSQGRRARWRAGGAGRGLWHACRVSAMCLVFLHSSLLGCCPHDKQRSQPLGAQCGRRPVPLPCELPCASCRASYRAQAAAQSAGLIALALPILHRRDGFEAPFLHAEEADGDVAESLFATSLDSDPKVNRKTPIAEEN
jgi:hypothetical protein